MMKNLKAATAALLIAGVGMWATGARAQQQRACSDELTAVSNAIGQAQFLGKNAAADASNLNGKVEEATAKAEQVKFADSIAKLADISSTATALASAPKPKLADASGINSAVDRAVACLSAP